MEQGSCGYESGWTRCGYWIDPHRQDRRAIHRGKKLLTCLHHPDGYREAVIQGSLRRPTRNGCVSHAHPPQNRAHLVLIANASNILLWKPLPAYENPVRAWASRFGGRR